MSLLLAGQSFARPYIQELHACSPSARPPPLLPPGLPQYAPSFATVAGRPRSSPSLVLSQLPATPFDGLSPRGTPAAFEGPAERVTCSRDPSLSHTERVTCSRDPSLSHSHQCHPHPHVGSGESNGGPTLGQRIRAFCFYVTTYTVALPLFFIMLFIQPFVLIFDKHKRTAQHFINKVWANLTILLFYKAEIEGLENLPGPDEAAVYVSNHQSFLDIYTLFLLGRPFKFISKTSNFLIPIIGWSMYLTGHVPLRRMDTKSQMECLRHCQKLIKQGVPVFFFPEGTRSRDGKMGQFKRGAFTIAAKAQVPVVPISLIGTGKLMPNGFEGTLRPGTVKVIIHPRICGSNPDELCEQSRNVISRSLSQHGLEVH